MSEKEEIFDKLAKALNEKDTVTCLSLMTQIVGTYQKEKDEEKPQKDKKEINIWTIRLYGPIGIKLTITKIIISIIKIICRQCHF